MTYPNERTIVLCGPACASARRCLCSMCKCCSSCTISCSSCPAMPDKSLDGQLANLLGLNYRLVIWHIFHQMTTGVLPRLRPSKLKRFRSRKARMMRQRMKKTSRSIFAATTSVSSWPTKRTMSSYMQWKTAFLLIFVHLLTNPLTLDKLEVVSNQLGVPQISRHGPVFHPRPHLELTFSHHHFGLKVLKNLVDGHHNQLVRHKISQVFLYSAFFCLNPCLHVSHLYYSTTWLCVHPADREKYCTVAGSESGNLENIVVQPKLWNFGQKSLKLGLFFLDNHHSGCYISEKK